MRSASKEVPSEVTANMNFRAKAIVYFCQRSPQRSSKTS